MAQANELARVKQEVERLQKLTSVLTRQIQSFQSTFDEELGKIIQLKVRLGPSPSSGGAVHPISEFEKDPNSLADILEQSLVVLALDGIMKEKLEAVEKTYNFYVACLDAIKTADATMLSLLQPSEKAAATALVLKLKNYLMTFPADIICSILRFIKQVAPNSSGEASLQEIDVEGLKQEIKALLPAIKGKADKSSDESEVDMFLNNLSGLFTSLATVMSPEYDLKNTSVLVPPIYPFLVEVRQVLEKNAVPDPAKDVQGHHAVILNGVLKYAKDLLDKFVLNYGIVKAICNEYELEMPEIKVPSWLEKVLEKSESSSCAGSG